MGKVEYMYYMLNGASAFNKNLCAWSPVMKQANPSADDMFKGSNCQSTDDPNLVVTPVAPLCKTSCQSLYRFIPVSFDCRLLSTPGISQLC